MSKIHPIYLPETVIDEMIVATGFDQVTGPAYGIEDKCQWLLERIGILREEALAGNILHDNPGLEALVALVEYQRQGLKSYQNTISIQHAELNELREKVRKLNG